MKRFNSLIPMQLQYFAEDDSGTGSDGGADNGQGLDDPKGADNQSEDNQDSNDSGDDPEKIIEKLQGRIGKEQGKKNELQQQLEKAQAELKKLRGGKKDQEPKDIEKTPEQIEVEKLRMQLERRDILDSTLDVFKESKIDMPKDIVELFISDDRDKTIDSAGKLLNFVTSIKKETEASVRSEYSGGKVPKSTKHTNSAANFGTQVAKSNNDRVPLQSNYSN